VCGGIRPRDLGAHSLLFVPECRVFYFNSCPNRSSSGCHALIKLQLCGLLPPPLLSCVRHLRLRRRSWRIFCQHRPREHNRRLDALKLPGSRRARPLCNAHLTSTVSATTGLTP
jgi:hypothetical protein